MDIKQFRQHLAKVSAQKASTITESIAVQSCKYVTLSMVLSGVEMKLFDDCEWNNFSFGDCDRSLLRRDTMIKELRESGEDFQSAIKILKTLPSDCFISI